jgi:hypothetical protein
VNGGSQPAGAWFDEAAAFDPTAQLLSPQWPAHRHMTEREQERLGRAVNAGIILGRGPAAEAYNRRAITADEYGSGSRTDLEYISPQRIGNTAMARAVVDAREQTPEGAKAAVEAGEPLWSRFYPISFAVDLPSCGIKLTDEEKADIEARYGIKAPDTYKP